MILQISELGINGMNPNQIRFTLTQLQRMARVNLQLKSKQEYKSVTILGFLKMALVIKL